MRKLRSSAVLILCIIASAFAALSEEIKGQEESAERARRIDIQAAGGRISVYAVDADLADVLRAIAAATGIDLALGEGITGKVNIDISAVAVEEALKKLCHSRALVYEYLPQKNGYRIVQAAAFAQTADASQRVRAASGPFGLSQIGLLPETAGGENAGLPASPPAQSVSDFRSGNTARPRYKAGELLVKFKPGVSDQEIEALHQSLGSKTLRKLERLKIQRIKLREGLSEATAMNLYAAAEIVEHAEKHALRYPSRLPDDPYYGQQWGPAKIAAPQAWEINQGWAQTVIAVIDSGVDYLHADLKNNIWINMMELNGFSGVDDDGNGFVDDIRGWDFAGTSGTDPGDPDPMDINGHGTHVAGSIAAVGDNGLGIAGINWQARIMPLKVQTDGANDFEGFAVIEAVQYAIANGAVLVNCSFGGYESSTLEREAFEDLKNAGILTVGAAGNDGLDSDIAGQEIYPAGYDIENIISAAASDSNDSLAAFSNYGASSVDVMAPGVDIYSTLPPGTNTLALVRAEGLPPVEYPAIGMLFAGLTDEDGISAAGYDCGKGYPEEFPDGVGDYIAIIERGSRDDNPFFFHEKVLNAQTAGAVGVIVYNHTVDDFDLNGGSLGSPGEWVPAVSITQADGAALRALGTPPVTLINKLSGISYHYKSGTSMAAAHVTGVAGLIKAQCPALAYSGIKAAILNTVDKVPGVAAKLVSGGRLNSILALEGIPVPGDLTRDCRVGLEDAVLALQILSASAFPLPYPCLWCGKDVNGDSRIGGEEAVFILQTLAGIRE